MFRKYLLFAGFGLAVLFLVFGQQKSFSEILDPLVRKKEPTKSGPLIKYYFENLRKRDFWGSEIKLEKVIKEEESYTSWLFSYQSDGKRVTGMANLPEGEGPFPVIIMFRGYADKEIYFTGLGTRKSAGVFAENGFLTLAPDFLGFGGSDWPSGDVLQARFEKPITVLDLLASLASLARADPKKVFFWAHSNGGQIALSVLEISGREIPTVLWAPVTKGFPQAVLDYMLEAELQLIYLYSLYRTSEQVFSQNDILHHPPQLLSSHIFSEET